MFELYFANKFLSIKIECSHLKASKLLSGLLPLVQDFQLRVRSDHEQHVIEFLDKF